MRWNYDFHRSGSIASEPFPPSLQGVAHSITLKHTSLVSSGFFFLSFLPEDESQMCGEPRETFRKTQSTSFTHKHDAHATEWVWFFVQKDLISLEKRFFLHEFFQKVSFKGSLTRSLVSNKSLKFSSIQECLVRIEYWTSGTVKVLGYRFEEGNRLVRHWRC